MQSLRLDPRRGRSPDVCVSCGATADRFRPMDEAEVDAVTGALSSYGVASQGFDDIEVDYTRRIRLLSFVDASFYTNFVERSGPRLPIYTGDPQWFSDNIPCMTACPSHTDISRYIALIADGRYADSFELNREHNVFPGCLGRMCARPCEDACRRKEVDAPIGICYLKRVAADYRGETRREVAATVERTDRRRHRGRRQRSDRRARPRPQGLQGHHLRALPGAGWGDVVRSAGVAPAARRHHGRGQLITDLGIEIRYNTEVGRDITFKELVDTHDAVIISAGCQIPQELGVPGEDLDGVVSGLQFLEDVNLGQKDVWVGKRVVTVGGGFTSMDCVRTVLRMGAEQSIMTYRRSIQEIPVDALELEEAEHEGVEIMYMVAPTRVIDDGQGRVAGIELIRNELGAPDDKGRRRPEPVAGSEFVIPCDMVLVAIGQRQDNRLLTGVEVQTDRRGVPVLDENLKSELPNVWASGDYVVNPTNFISSIGEGKRVATFIDEDLRDVEPKVKEMEITRVPTEFISTPNPLLSEGIAEWTLSTTSRRLVWGDNYTSVGRQMMPAMPLSDRGINTGDTTIETEIGYTKPIGFEEAKRCLQCQLNIFIDGNRCILCANCVDVCPVKCIEMVSTDRIHSIDGDVELAEMARAELGPQAAVMLIDERPCIRCALCVDWCPTECLTMDHFRLTPAPERESVDLAVVAD